MKRQRDFYKENKIPPDRLDLLNKINFDFTGENTIGSKNGPSTYSSVSPAVIKKKSEKGQTGYFMCSTEGMIFVLKRDEHSQPLVYTFSAAL